MLYHDCSLLHCLYLCVSDPSLYELPQLAYLLVVFFSKGSKSVCWCELVITYWWQGCCVWTLLACSSWHYWATSQNLTNRESWLQYARRLSHFFAANGVTVAARKKSAFLSVIGPDSFKLLESLLAPNTPEDKSYEELVETLTKCYSPEPSEVMERYKFFARICQPGESIATFMSELRRLSKTCNFGDLLDSMLQDRLVCGVNDDHIQRQLLQEKDLQLDRATEIALSLEVAAKELQLLHKEPGGPLGNLHKVRSTIGPPKKTTHIPCYRCGKLTHEPVHCPFRLKDCFFCKKRGHPQAVCHSKLKLYGEKGGKGHHVNNCRHL